MSTCYADPNPIFRPAMRLIASITNSLPAVVTTTFAHQYASGTIVRLDIPAIDGMPELNGNTYPILVTGDTTFEIPVDSTRFQPFAIPVSPSPFDNTCAMVVPVGSSNDTLKPAVFNRLNPQIVGGI